jgi:hypothetical protein
MPSLGLIPWWGWLFVALWCAPGAYCFVAAIRLEPPMNLVQVKVPPWWKKAILFPIFLVIFLVLGPLVVLAEFWNCRCR